MTKTIYGPWRVCFVAAPWHWSLGYVTVRRRFAVRGGYCLRALCLGPVELQHLQVKA